MKKRKDERHGMSHTKFYKRWKSMMSRCNIPTHQVYHNYGGRGITVCERWHKFTNFMDDMYDGFDECLQLDRIDNNKGYSKENCRWVTHKENSRNRRTTRFYKGETATEASWRIAGNSQIVLDRLCKGWSLERAFTTPKLR